MPITNYLFIKRIIKFFAFIIDNIKTNINFVFNYKKRKAVPQVLLIEVVNISDLAHAHNIFVLLTPSIYYALNDEKITIVQSLHNYRLICPNGLLYRDNKICEDCLGGNFLPSIFHRCWRNSFLSTISLN